MANPLFAERYAEEMVDRMVEYAIRKDPLLEDTKKAALIEDARKEWLEKARVARKEQNKGIHGLLISINEDVKGEILYVGNTLYTDTVFDTAPGPNLHFYVTTVPDPRDVEFPDETAVDIGKLDSAYGAQAYAVPTVDDALQYQTAVLWDNDIGRLYGFAQLTK